MLEDALTRIPGLAGYLAKGRYDQQQQGAELQNTAALSSLLGGLQQQQAFSQEAQRTAKLRDVLNGLTPEQMNNPQEMKNLFLQHAAPKDALAALYKNPMEGMPDIVKTAMLAKNYRAAGDTQTAELLEAKLKKDTSTETSKEQENINFLTDLSIRARSGQKITPTDFAKGTAIYRMTNAPRFDPATGQTYTPNLGAQFDPERDFGLRMPGATVGNAAPSGKLDITGIPEPRINVTEPTKPVFTDIKEDGRGGYVGFNKNTGRVEQVPTDVAPPTKPLKDIPTSVLTGMMENTRSLDKIDQAIAGISGNQAAMHKGVTADKEATGFKGYLPNVLLNRIDPKGTDVRALIADIGSLKIHDRSGAAVTAAEAPRLMPFIPLTTDDATTIKKKLGNFKREYELMQKETSDYFNAENGFKPYKPTRREDISSNVFDEADAILKGGR